MAAQYWRAVALQSYDGRTLRLSEFQLFYLGNRLDGAATLTGNAAPSAGALANLKDDDLNTFAEWTGRPMRDLVLSWDFGSAVDIDDICIGTHNDTNKSLLSCGLQYASSSSGPWTERKTYSNIWCPGVGAKSVSAATCLFDPLGSMAAGAINFTFTSLNAQRTQISAATGTASIRGATARSAGVLQFEFDVAWVASCPTVIGIQLVSGSSSSNPTGGSGGWGFAPVNGSKYANSVSTAGYCTAFGASGSWTVGCVIDFTAGSITFYKNGVSLGVAYTGLALTAGIVPIISPSTTIVAGVSVTATIRASGFNFPIAGAQPWDATTSIFTLWKTNGMGVGVDGFISPPAIPLVSRAPDPSFIAPVTYGRITGNYYALNYWEDPYLRGGSIDNNTWGNISGTVTVAGVPTKRRVRLFRDIDSQCFGEQWSDPVTGAVQFNELPKKWKFTGVAEDYTDTYQWLIWNGVYPA